PLMYSRSAPHRALPPFPTRRSSDLDGFHASQATVRRALRARALLQPPGVSRERRQLAKQRKLAFRPAPARRNRVWQTDFSEHETDRKSTRLNSSHLVISYAVFCLKK